MDMDITKILSMKIGYNSMTPLYTEIALSSSGIKLNAILAQVNKFIAKNAIVDFLDILIKTQGNWKNVIEVFGHSETTDFMVESINDKPTIQIQLVESSKQEEEEQMLKHWEKKIIRVNKKSNEINKKIMKDVEKVEEDNQIDLAFFYSEPISILRDGKFENTKRQVSFLTETRRIFDKLDPKNNNFKRSANIQIAVATRENICKALSKGVKILHFSCHGNKQGLEVELQSDKIGLADLISCEALLQILLKYKLPQIIVFNSCHSSDLANSIYDKFEAEDKHIATVGYQDRVLDSVCDEFSEKFYSNFFSGQQIDKCFNVLKNNDKIKIFYKPELLKKKITFTATKISEHNKIIEIKNKTQIDQIGINFPRDNLFKFVNDLMSQKRPLINLIGPFEVGKTFFTKKSLSYLWQRNYIYNFLIIDLRQSDHQIANIIEFSCKLQTQIKNSEILQKSKNQQQNYIITIDHCDSLLIYQLHHLKKCISRLLDRLKSKIILVSRKSLDQRDANIETFDLTTKYKQSWKENSRNLVQEPKVQKKPRYINLDEFSMREFVQNCYGFIYNWVERLPKQFLSLLPFVSIFPQSIYDHSRKQREEFAARNVQIENMQILCQDAIKKLKYQISIMLTLQLKDQLIKTRQLIQQMYLIAGTQFLISYFINKPQYNLTISQESKQRLIAVAYRLIDLCLVMDEVDDQNVKRAFKIFRIKLNFVIFAYHAYSTVNTCMYNITQILVESVEADQESQYHKYYQSTLEVLLKHSKLCQTLYGFHKPKQTANIFDAECKKYLKITKQMKRTLQESEIFLSQDQKFWNKFDYYEPSQIKALRLPLLAILKQEIIHLTHLNQEPDRKKIEKIKQLIKEYQFLEEPESTLFSHLYTHFYEGYLSVLFEFEKFKLSHPKVDKSLVKFEVIHRINKWIDSCCAKGYHELRNEIESYKAQVFNIFVAFVSSPLNKVFRFENAVPEMLKQTYRNLDKQILLKLEPLTKQAIQKYTQLRLTIPLSLFLVDTKTSNQVSALRRKLQNKNEVYLCLQKFDNRTEQYCEFFEVNKLDFFQCEIAIFFGDSVSKIQSDETYKKFRAVVCIDTKLQRYEKVRTNQQHVRQKLDEVVHGLIAKQFLTNFYSSFCKSLFDQDSQRFKDRVDQIEKSFETAKKLAKLTCLFKLGGYFQQIKSFWEQITLTFTNKQATKLLPPLKIIKKSEIFKIDEERIDAYSRLKRKTQRNRNQIIQSLDQSSEVGYQRQIHQIMRHIFGYLQKKKQKETSKLGTQYLILVCKNQEEQTLINAICARVKRLTNLQIQSVNLRNVRKKSADSLNHSIGEYQADPTILGIMDLTGLAIEKAEQAIKQKFDDEEQVQEIENYSVTKIIFFIVKQFPLGLQNCELKHIEKIIVNKLENENIIPLLIRRILLNKIEAKDYSKNWEGPFVSKFAKKISERIFAEESSQKTEDYSKRRTKIQHILVELLKS